jgi:hypothetical protein
MDAWRLELDLRQLARKKEVWSRDGNENELEYATGATVASNYPLQTHPRSLRSGKLAMSRTQPKNQLRTVLKSRATDPRSGGFYQTWTVAFVLTLYCVEWIALPSAGVAPGPVVALATFLVAVIADRLSEITTYQDRRLY